MPNYWIFPIYQENYSICLDRKIVGVSETRASRLHNIRVGDLLIFYVSRSSFNDSSLPIKEFSALVKSIGNSFKSKEEIWPTLLGFWSSTRMPIEIIHTKKCKAEDLVDKLSFIKNKTYWGTAFRAGIRKISEHDFNTILKAMK